MGQKYWEDGSIRETAKCILHAREQGFFNAAGADPDLFKKLAEKIGEERGVRKKALLRPMRLCLTSQEHGPELAALCHLLAAFSHDILCEFVPLERRFELLQKLRDDSASSHNHALADPRGTRLPG